ncbi:MAG TPA: hypothetical protein VGJ56_33760, partial [Reyranella sp.]
PPPASMFGQGLVATEQLLMARQSLITGRPDEARRLLAMAQMQMVFRPTERVQHAKSVPRDTIKVRKPDNQDEKVVALLVS